MRRYNPAFAGEFDDESFVSSSSADAPLPSNAFDSTFYESHWDLPEGMENLPVEAITDTILQQIIFPAVNFTARLVQRDGPNYYPIGTIVFISPNEVITNRHCVEDKVLPICVLMDDGTFCEVANIRHDLNGLDISLLTLKQTPSVYESVSVDLEDQLGGRYFMIHYAEDRGKFMSTGDAIQVGSFYKLQENLFMAGGDGASGAGIFNHHGRLVGINSTRANESGVITRIPILLSDTTLFKQVLACKVPLDSPIRAGDVGVSDLSAHSDMMGYSYEHERIKGKTQFDQMVNFLRELKTFVSAKKYQQYEQQALDARPPWATAELNLLDEHSSKHEGGRVGAATFLGPLLTSKQLLQALIRCCVKIVSEYFRRYLLPKADTPEKRAELDGKNYIIDLGFYIGFDTSGGKHPVRGLMITGDIMTSNHKEVSFHVYPIDTNTKRDNAVKIDWERDIKRVLEIEFAPPVGTKPILQIK